MYNNKQRFLAILLLFSMAIVGLVRPVEVFAEQVRAGNVEVVDSADNEVENKENKEGNQEDSNTVDNIQSIESTVDTATDMFSIKDNGIYDYNIQVDDNGNEYITIIGLTKDVDNKDLEIPNEIDGIPVKVIGDFAFLDSDIKSVILNDNLIKIGKYAFANNNIKDLELTSNIESIEEYAFRDNNIGSVNIEDTKVSILSEGVFLNNNIKEVNMSNIEKLEDYSLSGNDISIINIVKDNTVIDNRALLNNNKYVQLTGKTGNVESYKETGSYGHVKDTVILTVKSIDKNTGKSIMDDYVLGNDFTKEGGVIIKGTENIISPIDIQGYVPVKKEYKINPVNDKEIVTVEYQSTKTKPVIKVVKDLRLEVGSTVDEKVLKSLVQVIDYKGDDITDKLTVTPSSIDTSNPGFIEVLYEVEDDKGNKAAEVINVGIGKDYNELEIGNGWVLGDFTYDIDKPHIVTGLSESGKEKALTNKDLVMPTMNPNNPEIEITEIADSAFELLTDINSIDLSKIEIVGNKAFANSKLKELKGDKVKIIKNNSFKDAQLSELVLLQVEMIGDNAFADSNIDKLVIPKAKSVGMSSFENSKLRDEFVIDNLVKAGRNSFSYINREKVYAPKLEVVEESAFYRYYDYNSEQIEQPIKELYVPSLKRVEANGFNNAQLSELDAPLLEYVGDYSFNSSPLTNLKANNIKVLKDYAFGNALLEEVQLDNIEHIGSLVFENARGSSEYNNYLVIKSKNAYANGVYNKENYIINPNKEEAKKQDSRFTEDDFIYADEDKTEIIALTEVGMMKLCKNDFHLVLPDNVTTIGSGVFYNSNVKSVVGKNVVEVKDKGFEKARNLEFVHFPNLRIVGSQGFMNSSLTDLDFPKLERIEYSGFSGIPLNKDSKVNLNNVKYLGSSGLYNVGLTELELESVEYIGEYALVGNRLNYLDIRNVKVIRPNAITDLNMDTLTLNKLEELSPDSFLYWYDSPDIDKTHKNIFILNDDGTFNNNTGIVSSEYLTINPSNRYVKFVDENGVEISKEDVVIVNQYKYDKGTTIYTPTNLYGYELVTKPFDLEDYDDEETIVVKYKKVDKPQVERQDGLQFDAIYSNNTSHYHIGDNMALRLRLNLTTDAQPLEKPTMRIYFDENDVDISKVMTDTSSDLVEGITIGKGYVDIKLSAKLNAGESLDVPLDNFKFKKYVSQDNITTNVYAELYSGDKLIDEEGPLTYTGYYEKPVYKEAIQTPVSDMKPTTDGPRDFGDMGYIGPEGNKTVAVVNPKDVEINYIPVDKYGNKAAEIERNIERIILKHELPLYTKINEDGSEEVVRASFNPKNNPGWKLSEDGNSVIYDADTYPSPKINMPKLKLQFPGMKNDTQTESRFELTLIPHNKGDNESNIVIEDSIKIYPFARFFPGEAGETYFDKRAVGTPRYNGDLGMTYLFDYKADKENTIPFKITFGGKSDKEKDIYFNNTTITDYKLDEKLKYTGITLPEIMGERVTVKTYRKNNTVINPLNDIVIQEQEYLLNRPVTMDFINQEDIDYVQVIFDKDFIVDGMYELLVLTEMIDKETSVYNNEDITKNKMWNRAIMSGDYVNDKGESIQDDNLWGTIYTDVIENNKEIYEEIKEDTKHIEGNSIGVRDDFVEILDVKAIVGLNKQQVFFSRDKEDVVDKQGIKVKVEDGIVKDTADNNSPTVKTDMKGLYNISLSHNENDGIFEDYENFKLVDVLPKEVAFESYTINPDVLKGSENVKVTIDPNYDNTNQTAVIFTADKLDRKAKDLLNIKVEILDNTVNDSVIKNEVKATWSNEKIEKAYDRDNDDFTVSNKVSVKTSSAMAMISKKKIRNYEENLPQNFGWKEHIKTPSEGLFEYKLSVFNGTENNTANVTMVDLFPYTSDYSIQFLNEDDKLRVPRLSEFSNTLDLDREIIVPEGYTVKYYLSDVDEIDYAGMDADTFINSIEWSSEPGDNPDRIRGIKVEGNDTILKAGDTAEVIIPMKAPVNDFNTDFSVNGRKAVNSFVVKEAEHKESLDRIRFLEPNMVSNTMVGPRGSLEIVKYGKLGILQEILGAQPLEGAKFEIRNSQDEIVQVVTSNNEGKVLFTDLDVFDTFTVREIESPEGYLPSDAVLKITSKDFMEVHDKNYHIEKDTKELFLNRKPYKGSLQIEKVDNKGNLLSNVGFTLTGKNDKGEEVVMRKYTNSNGFVEFKNILEGYWLLEEIAADNVTGLEPIEPMWVLIDKDNIDHKYLVDENNPIVNDTGQLVLNKLSVPTDFTNDNLDEIISTKYTKLPNHEFIVLDKDGNETQRVKTNEKGLVMIKGLKLNEEYSIKEVKESVEKTHKHNDLEYKFMLKSDGKIVNLSNGKEHKENAINFPNAKKDVKGNINIVKLDENKEVLKGAEFTLYDNKNNIIDTQVSDNEGKISFVNIDKGIYTLKETKAPEGYYADFIKENIVISEVETNEYTIDYTKDNLEVNYNIEVINKPLDLKLIKGSEYIMATIEEAKDFTSKNPEYKYMVISETMARIYLPLEDVKFELFTSDNESQGIFVSNNEGIVDFKGYKFDENIEYYLIEKSTHKDYKLNTTPIVVNPSIFKMQKDFNGVMEIYFNNEKKDGRITISKYGEMENGKFEALEGAEFTLYRKDTDTDTLIKMNTFETNSAGMAVFSGLPLNETYVIKETKAVSGYRYSQSEWEVRLTGDNEHFKLPIYNYLNKTILPETGVMNMLVLSILIILSYVVYNKRKNK